MPAENAIAFVCDYCGRKNEERLLHCTGCGTPLAKEILEDELQPKKKSKILAALLAGIIGPLGVCYVNVEKAVYLWLGMLVVGFLCLGGHVHIGFAFLLSRIVSVGRALTLLQEQEIALDPKQNPQFLLDQAARMENVDKLKAIVAYEEIIQQFPNTKESDEASRNIAVLKCAK